MGGGGNRGVWFVGGATWVVGGGKAEDGWDVSGSAGWRSLEKFKEVNK